MVIERAPTRLRLRAKGGAIAALLGLVLLWSARAGAQATPRPVDAATARALAKQGGALFSEGRYEEATEYYERAETFFHAPTHVLMIARSQVARNALLEAREAYNRVLREPLAANASRAFREAVRDARAELAALEPRIPTLEVTATGGDHIRVEVNGSRWPAAALGVPRPVNPGSYSIAGTADGLPSAHVELSVKEGDHAVARLDLAPPRAASPPAAPPAIPPPSIPMHDDAHPAAPGQKPRAGPAAPSGDASRDAAPLFLMGVGGAALVVGAVTFAVSRTAKGDLEPRCPGGRCADASDQVKLDRADSFGTISAASFAIGGGGVAIGGLFLALMHARARPAARAAELSPWVSGSSAGLRGTF